MFNKQNFCHIASNNRNDVKTGVFVYKTTDDLETVLASGYFNEKIIDINLHDLIIHEWHDPVDRTNVLRNVLCVVERTLDNVGTTVIRSNWQSDIEDAIEDLQEYVDNTFVKKSGDTMTGALEIKVASTGGNPEPALKISSTAGPVSTELSSNGYGVLRISGQTIVTPSVTPRDNNARDLGEIANHWRKAFVNLLNNGGDLEVPAVSGTIATKADVDLAANSGDQLTDKGVWYAKMYAATVAPAAEDGTNYADFSQTDGQGNPIIVLYERQNGAWVQDQTITPPADYNGYVTVTSKIWDIVEQDGQQGGQVLWSRNQKTFTPYPKIISFEDAHLTGNSTTQMPAQPTGQTIVNVDYLSNHTGSGKNVGDVFFTMRNDNALSGAVECNGATYNTEDFVGSGTISGLLTAGKIPYVSLAQYETLLSTQGSVGVFGWDGGSATTFRVPSLNDIFIETGTAAQIGDYLPAGAPNLKGKFTCSAAPYSSGVTASGVFTASTGGASLDSGSGGQNGTVTLDASRASDVYKDDATTIQPNTVRYRAMVQLATGATDEALETCTQVLADVAELKYDYVVASQAPTAANNYTWYRKYKSGWVEQGGKKLTSSNQNNWVTNTVALAIEMADTDYHVMLSNCNLTNGAYGSGTHVPTKTTTSFDISQFNINGGSGSEIVWEVKGMAA
jgi:hypothetical protein